jgi:hypothetical protein
MFNKKPMKVLQKYLEVINLLVSNSAAKEDSLETYVLQEALLDSLIEKINLTKNDINLNMISALAEETPN